MATKVAVPVESDAAVAADPFPANDLLTVIGIALIVGLIAVFVHEALGHGLAVVLTGHQLTRVTSVDAEFDDGAIAPGALRFIAAAGAFANVVVGFLAWGALRAARGAQGRYFLWLLGFSNFLVAGGYLLALSFTSFGDVHDFMAGLPLKPLWQIVSTAIGVVVSLVALRLAMRRLDPFLGWGLAARKRRAIMLALPPYFAIGVSAIVAGALNPTSPELILISAAAASFGGNAFLVWLPMWVHEESATTPREPLIVGRSWPWIAAGVVALLLRVVVLGPGLPR
jgi:hypothetical protein